MVNFREPLLADVFERGGGGNAEAHEEDIGLGIRKWSETVVIFLSCSIEEAEGIRLIADPAKFTLTHLSKASHIFDMCISLSLSIRKNGGLT